MIWDTIWHHMDIWYHTYNMIWIWNTILTIWYEYMIQYLRYDMDLWLWTSQRTSPWTTGRRKDLEEDSCRCWTRMRQSWQEKNEKRIILTYHSRNNVDNDVMKETHLKIVLYHRASTTTTVLSAKEEMEISKTAEAGARIASVSPRQTGWLFFLSFVCLFVCLYHLAK